MTPSPKRDRHAWAILTFTWLLWLYPASFRRRFGDEMVGVFRTSCRAAERDGGTWAVVEIWMAALPDMLITAIKERLTSLGRTIKERNMQPSTLLRIGGIMAFVAVFFQVVVHGLVFAFDDGHKLLYGAEMASLLAFLLVLMGLAAAQRSQVGRWLWGSIAAGMVIGGLALQAIPGVPGMLVTFEHGTGHPLGHAWGIVATAFAVPLFIGAVVASIITLRGGTLGRWSIMPLLGTLWTVVSYFFSALVFRMLIAQVTGPFPTSGYRYLVPLSDLLVVLPGWIFLLCTGIGLLNLARQTAAAPAPQLSDAVQ